MTTAARASRADGATRLGREAARWLVDVPVPATEDPSLNHGAAGIVVALREAAEHLSDDAFAAAADARTDELEAVIDNITDCSLYFGLAGIAGVMRTMGREAAADRALDRIRARAHDGRWSPMFELLFGNAGVGLGALWAGDLELAVTAVTPYLTTADRTPHGVNWAVRPTPARSHHIAHGTLGIAYACAAIGRAAGRDDLIDLALAGAADVVARNETGPDGFLVPHSDPPHRPELIERYSLGWCNGPAGDAQVFRLLADITGDPQWIALVDACWRTVVGSGLPVRARPGFWDNNGRCCGTAGVLALACDRIAAGRDDPGFADVLVDDLAGRAIVDDAGARWSNHEHRATPSDLAPQPGWAMGNAGILRELLRYARLSVSGPTGYAVQWPDQLAIVSRS